VCWERSERHLRQFRKLWSQHGAALATQVAEVFTNPGGVAQEHPRKPERGDNGSESGSGNNGVETGKGAVEIIVAASEGRRSA
jgi:hypothetical protein